MEPTLREVAYSSCRAHLDTLASHADVSPLALVIGTVGLGSYTIGGALGGQRDALLGGMREDKKDKGGKQ
ncbi:hypothetical protein [Calidifontibacter terrae]